MTIRRMDNVGIVVDDLEAATAFPIQGRYATPSPDPAPSYYYGVMSGTRVRGGHPPIRTFRQECLDHVIVLNERHLHALLTEFVGYYNHERPHRSLSQESPVPREVIRDGPIVSRPILGGLHHAYARAA